MELRNHPLMAQGGDRIWPPRWRCVSTKEEKVAEGEIGVLEKVARRKNNIILYIEHEGEIYRGSMSFENEYFCNRIYELFKVVRGYPVNFIGGRDVGV